MGCYLAPSNRTTIRDVEEAIAQKRKGVKLIVVGGLKVDIGKESGRGRDKEITAVVTTAGLEDLAGSCRTLTPS